MSMLYSLYQYDKKDELEFHPILYGWHTLHEPLSNATNIHWCKRLIAYEIDKLNRQHIIDRIVSKIIKLTSDQERKNIHEFIKAKNKRREHRR